MSKSTYLESRLGKPDKELLEHLLLDPSKKEMFQKQLAEVEPTPCGTSSLPPHLTPSGTNQMCSISMTSSMTDRANLTSGPWPAPRHHGGFKSRIFPPPPAPAPSHKGASSLYCLSLWPPHMAPTPPHLDSSGSTVSVPSCSDNASVSGQQPLSSRKRLLRDNSGLFQDSEVEEEDTLTLLSEAEALELAEYDPAVQSEDTWDPPSVIKAFLERHFNRLLSEEEKKKILGDSPKPACDAVQVPRLDAVEGAPQEQGQRSTLYFREDPLQAS